MLSKEIAYTDYNGVEKTETFYFNLTRAEIIELEVTHPGGLAEDMERAMKAKDPIKLFVLFKELIGASYGVKSDDGRRFMKGEEISRSFFESPAYDQLYMQMTTDEKFAADFVKGILPLESLDGDTKDELLKAFDDRIKEQKTNAMVTQA